MKIPILLITIVLTFLPIGFYCQQSESGTVRDIDGNVYKTVKIGNQWWMAENLKVTRNPKGQSIRSYFYDDDPASYGKYGRLYTWDVAMDAASQENAQGIAPDGWHIPSDDDWQELLETMGGEDRVAENIKVDGSSGFNAYLSGGADFRGNYLYFNKYAMFWSSTAAGKDRAFHVGISNENRWDKFAAKKNARIHIRCIKDN